MRNSCCSEVVNVSVKQSAAVEADDRVQAIVTLHKAKVSSHASCSLYKYFSFDVIHLTQKIIYLFIYLFISSALTFKNRS